jgi:uncharacterized RDD family membrane protein YckC
LLAMELSQREVEERAARFSRRLAGQLIDVVITVAVSGDIAVIVQGTTIYNAIAWPLTALYYSWCERRGSGQTIGKRAMRIRVVDDVKGVPIGLPRALYRTLRIAYRTLGIHAGVSHRNLVRTESRDAQLAR